MQSSLIQVRVDESMKESAGKIFEQLGIDIPTAIRMFLAKSILENGIPFNMKVSKREPMVPSDVLAAMKAASASAEKAGIADMSLDEINAEIAAARAGE